MIELLNVNKCVVCYARYVNDKGFWRLIEHLVERGEFQVVIIWLGNRTDGVGDEVWDGIFVLRLMLNADLLLEGFLILNVHLIHTEIPLFLKLFFIYCHLILGIVEALQQHLLDTSGLLSVMLLM